MKISDVIVIGGGLAGLMAAAVAASHKQKVTVLTYGSGSLPLASGAIDFLNAKTPDTAIKTLCTPSKIFSAAQMLINLIST